MAINLSNILAKQSAPPVPEMPAAADIPQVQPGIDLVQGTAGDVVTAREQLGNEPFTYEEGLSGGLERAPVEPEVVQDYIRQQEESLQAPDVQPVGEEFNPYAEGLDPRARLQASAEQVGTAEPKVTGLAALASQREAEQGGPKEKRVGNGVLDRWSDNVKTQRDNMFTETPQGPTVKDTGLPIINSLNDAGYFQQEADVNRVPEALEISFNNVAEDIKKYRLEKQSGELEIKKKTGLQAALDRATGKSSIDVEKRDIPVGESLGRLDEGLTDLANQPILRSMVSNVTQGLDSQFRTADTTTQPFSQEGIAKNTKKDNAALATIRQWTKDGDISWGLNNGMLMPIVSKKGETRAADSAIIQQTFNPAARKLAREGSLSQVQPFASPKGNILSDVQRAYAPKGGWKDPNAQGNTISNATMSILSSVFMQTSPQQRAMAEAMLADVENRMVEPTAETPFPYSESAFSETVLNAPINRESVQSVYDSAFKRQMNTYAQNEELARQDAVKEATSYVNSSLQQANRHIREDAVTNMEKPYTLLFDRSAINGRFNAVGSNAQLQAHKGTYRNFFQFANVPKTFGITKGGVESAVRRGVEIFKNQNNLRGEALGVHTLDQLTQLGQNSERIIDVLYVSGTLHNNNTGEINNPTYADLIQYGYDNLDAIASKGKRLKNWSPEQGMNGVEDILGELEKGEWGFPVSVYTAASNLKDAIDTGGLTGATADLNYTVEADSKQSNAMLMSIVMNDPQIMDLLSGLLDLDDTPDYRDLRTLALQTVTKPDSKGELSDIDQIFRAPGDEGTHKALTDFFRASEGVQGFAKMYARGIVVAGLYGKTPWKMTEEINTFLSHGRIAPQVNALRSEYEKMFGDKAEQKLNEDLGQLMAKTMSRHMSSLQGYQNIVKGLQTVRGAMGNTTVIESMIPGEFIAGAANDVLNLESQQQIDQLLDSALSGATLEAGPQDIGGATTTPFVNYQTPDARAELASGGDVERGRLSRAGAEPGANVSFYGEKLTNQVPPTLIHSADAYGIATATLAANQGKEGTNQPPVPMTTIHDAILTGPGATLRTLVAYNNIFPNLMVDRGGSYLEKDLAGIHEQFGQMIGEVLDAGQPVMIGDNAVKHKGLMGFFDKHFYNLDDAFLFEELGNDVGSRDSFLSDRQKARQTAQEHASARKSQKKSQVVLKKAMELGWLPPTKRNAEERKTLTLSAEEFAQAMILMLEATGMSPEAKHRMLPDKIDGEYVSVNWISSNLGVGSSPTDNRSNQKKKDKELLRKAIKQSNVFGKNMTIDL